jgi:hypothetical protein
MLFFLFLNIINRLNTPSKKNIKKNLLQLKLCGIQKEKYNIPENSNVNKEVFT